MSKVTGPEGREVVQRLRVAGELACFTRPEFKVERVSYPVITPSAARGVFEAILWKPAIRWRIRRVHVLAPIRFVGLKRNELAGKVSGVSASLVAEGGEFGRAHIEDKRQQRNSLLLADVDYLIEARFEMTDRAGEGDNPAKFAEMFRRRLAKGQQFHQPYLGCREFLARVTPPAGDERAIADTRDLGLMTWDTEFVEQKGKGRTSASWRDGGRVVKGHAHQKLFPARLVDGVMDVPADPDAALREHLGVSGEVGGMGAIE